MQLKQPVSLCRYLLMVILMLVMVACVSVGVSTLPPMLTQDELVLPYQKVGVLEVTRERFGSSEVVSSGDYEWAHRALREQAARIGADAVIFPEITVSTKSYLLFPTSDIKVKGVAIKFR